MVLLRTSPHPKASTLLMCGSCLQRELCLYSPALLQKPALVVANKVDSLEGHASAQALMTLQQSTDLPVLAVSGLQQTNISELRDALLHHDLHCASNHMATIEVAKE
jgi:GTPase involved in cell partitioning and DNA repair